MELLMLSMDGRLKYLMLIRKSAIAKRANEIFFITALFNFKVKLKHKVLKLPISHTC